MIKSTSLYLPEDYKSSLSGIETEIGIKFIKDTFQAELASALNLLRVSAPLFVPAQSGLNDNLSGVERPVIFDIPELNQDFEIVQSLAKWKRMALKRYEFNVESGLYTDMNAIRRDEEVLDNTHSVYVDQWDWEQVIDESMRTHEKLDSVVKLIVSAIYETQVRLIEKFPELNPTVTEKNVHIITSQELEDKYPHLSPGERENAICREYKSVFIKQIGKTLKSGQKHDGRAPDYDDWELNGDILFWYEPLDKAIELSSMGIRVDAKSLMSQLEEKGQTEKLKYSYHQKIISGELPLTIGGGIGQSRLCMIMLNKIHIGEVQASVWPKDVLLACKRQGVQLL